MNETIIGTIPVVGTALQTLSSYFYMLGGRSKKWRRRFIGSFIASTGLWCEYLLMGLFNPYLLLDYPITCIAWCLGYGDDIPLKKVIKRSIVAGASILTSILLCFLFYEKSNGRVFLLLPADIILGALTVYLGVINPIQAAAEEYFISFLHRLTKLMFPFVLILN